MADPYIDIYETLLYGKCAAEQMREVCVGKVPAFDKAIHFAIAAQETANAEMADVLAKQPKTARVLDAAAVQAMAGDTLVRFGNHLDSLKGRPVDPRDFFRGDTPSALARRRITKLAAGVLHVLEATKTHKAKIRDAAYWIAELTDVHAELEIVEKQHRASKVAKLELGPEVGAAREKWLGVYNANKLLIKAVLAYVGKPELLPVVFDDLAEQHRVVGVVDDPPPAPVPHLNGSAPPPA